jgi:hypothetical protein
MQVSHLHENIEIVSRPSHGRQGLKATEDGLSHLVIMCGGKLPYKLLAGAELFEQTLNLFISGEHVQGARTQNLKLI